MFLILNSIKWPNCIVWVPILPGVGPEILKKKEGGWGGVAFYVGHHGWPTKKILGLKWSKNAKLKLETKAFGETFISVFSDFLHFYI